MIGKKTFIDSNILVYLAGNDDSKKKQVIAALHSDCIISTQVVSENINVCIKKLKMLKPEAFGFGKQLIRMFPVTIISSGTIEKAMSISEKYLFSYWDSLIIATALEQNCVILYSEDMQSGQVIEGKLTVINPFI